jgi:6-phospho-3-hexuloisomerase
LDKILTEMRELNSSLSPNALDTIAYEILNCSGKIIGLGAGRMGYSLQAFIMRLSHLGYKAYMIGDTTTPRIGKGDLVIVNSSSGETQSIILLAELAVQHGARVLGITSGKTSSLTKLAQTCIFYNEINSNQLMKTAYEQFSYLLLDSSAAILATKGSLSVREIEKNHSILE